MKRDGRNSSVVTPPKRRQLLVRFLFRHVLCPLQAAAAVIGSHFVPYGAKVIKEVFGVSARLLTNCYDERVIGLRAGIWVEPSQTLSEPKADVRVAPGKVDVGNVRRKVSCDLLVNRDVPIVSAL